MTSLGAPSVVETPAYPDFRAHLITCSLQADSNVPLNFSKDRPIEPVRVPMS